MFAGDGFHPSPTLHAAFGDAVMSSLSFPQKAPKASSAVDLAPLEPLP
jgi:phospholipase/lecithinase/hemolysin